MSFFPPGGSEENETGELDPSNLCRRCRNGQETICHNTWKDRKESNFSVYLETSLSLSFILSPTFHSLGHTSRFPLLTVFELRCST